MLREGIHGLADDEVVKYSNLYQSKSILEFRSNRAVRLTWLTNPARVVVS